uniref:Protein DP71L n=1 Tax=Strigamia maritima TaxID=126957 RepID=T1JNK2_STRMM
MPNKNLYNLCENMLYHEPTMEDKMTEKHTFSRLFNGLTGSGLNTTCKLSNNCKLPHQSFLGQKNDEFAMYDKIVKAEPHEEICNTEIDILQSNILLQIRYGMQIGAETKTKCENSENSPAPESASKAASSSVNLSKNLDKETAEPSLEINENLKVCDKTWKKRSNRRAKSRSAVMREKKRTRCNNRRSRKANRSNSVKNDQHCTLIQEKVVLQDESSVNEEKKVEFIAELEDKVPALQFGVGIEWSFVSESEDEDLPFVSECNSVSYIIDRRESLTICLEDDWDCVDDDWDCVDNADDDNDDVWASFQQCGLQTAGLFLGNFVCQDAIDGSAMCDDESEEELNYRIRIADANARWERGLRDEKFIESCSEKKKVHFASDLVEVHSLAIEDDEDSRKGPWEEYARDRERFTKKIEDLDTIISPVLSATHRAKIYKKLYC